MEASTGRDDEQQQRHDAPVAAARRSTAGRPAAPPTMFGAVWRFSHTV
jgi:hypothetical protein